MVRRNGSLRRAVCSAGETKSSRNTCSPSPRIASGLRSTVPLRLRAWVLAVAASAPLIRRACRSCRDAPSAQSLARYEAMETSRRALPMSKMIAAPSGLAATTRVGLLRRINPSGTVNSKRRSRCKKVLPSMIP